MPYSGQAMKVHKLLKERGIKLKFFGKEKRALKKLKGKEIITNDSEFSINLLKKAGFNFYHVVDKASLETVETIKEEMKDIMAEEIVGIGGGKAIDVAKKVASDLNIKLISFPTAPSHDGLISKNCSLYNKTGKRVTIPAVYPSKLYIPLRLWEKSGNLRKSGICDLISNLVALQDISLAEQRGEKFNDLYKYLSLEATKRANFENEKHFAYALLFSGLAMEQTSRYCSGSDHIIERLLEENMNCSYLHGQLSGTGTLIAAMLYQKYADQLQNLRFDSKKLFDMVKSIMKQENILEFALKPLRDERFNHEWLKGLSQMRPDRYTVLNKIDSTTVHWEEITEELRRLA